MTFASPVIEEAIKQTHAVMVIFDPLQAFLGAKVDMFRANETRPQLAKLFEVCEREDCACAIVAHLAKGAADKSPVNRALGSVDIPAAMRSILHLIRNPDNPDECVMVQVKCSNAPKGRSIAYTIGDRGGVQWEGYSDMTPDDLTRVAKRKESGIPYDQEPLVQVFNQLITDKPGGGFWSYSELKAAGAKILGFPPYGDLNELRQKLDSGLAKELQKRDGLLGQQLVWGVKPGEVADFCQDHGSHAEPQPRDSGNRRMKLIHNGLDLLFDFINFTIQFTDEPDGVLQFKGLGRHLRANRVFGGISYFKSHIPFVVAIGGGFEQCFQPR